MFPHAVWYIVTFYVLIMLGMFLFQRKLMYYPARPMHPPIHYNMPHARFHPVQTQDGITIELWHQKPKDGFPLLVYFHGNAGHLGDRAPKLKHFVEAGFGLLAASYRGYGNSEGQPYQDGLFEDARTTLHYALQTLNYAPKDLLIYGESLGSGVATHAAWSLNQLGTPAGGLVIEAGYISVAQRSQEMYPWLPAYFLVRDKYLSITKIGDVGAPLLLFHGEKDVVIPVHHGRKLLETATAPKQGVFFDHIGHTDFDYPTLTHHLLEFSRTHGLQRQL